LCPPRPGASFPGSQGPQGTKRYCLGRLYRRIAAKNQDITRGLGGLEKKSYGQRGRHHLRPYCKSTCLGTLLHPADPAPDAQGQETGPVTAETYSESFPWPASRAAKHNAGNPREGEHLGAVRETSWSQKQREGAPEDVGGESPASCRTRITSLAGPDPRLPPLRPPTTHHHRLRVSIRPRCDRLFDHLSFIWVPVGVAGSGIPSRWELW